MNIENTIFFMWVIWYFYAYGPPPLMNYYFMKFYFIIDKVMIKYNKLFIKYNKLLIKYCIDGWY